VGEREVPERMSTEHLRTEERVVEEVVTSPCSPLECNGCVPTNRDLAGNGVRLYPPREVCQKLPVKLRLLIPAHWSSLSVFSG